MSVETLKPNFRQGFVLTGLGEVVSLLLLFAETVLAIRWLDVDRYGAYVILFTTVNLLMMAVDFGCKVAVTQHLSSADPDEQERLVSSVLAFRIITLLCVSVLVLSSTAVLTVFDSSATLLEYAGYLPVMLTTASIDELLWAMLQGFQSYKSMAIARVARGFLRIGLTVLFLTVFNTDIIGLVYSWSLSFALVSTYEFFALPVHRVWKWRWRTLLSVLQFGYPLQLTRLLGFVSTRFNIAVLAMFAGVDSVAYLAVAVRIPDALQMLGDSYFRVYFPSVTWMISTRRQQDVESMMGRSVRLISFVGGLAAVTAAAFSHEIMNTIFGEQYAATAPIFVLMMVALHMSLTVNVLGYTLTAAGQPGRSLGIDVVRSAVSAVLALVLIPLVGVIGAAWSLVGGSYASYPAAVRLVRSSHAQSGVDVGPYVRQTLLVLGYIGVLSVLAPADLIVAGILKLVLIASFSLLSVVMGSISLDDFSLRLVSQASEAKLASGEAG